MLEVASKTGSHQNRMKIGHILPALDNKYVRISSTLLISVLTDYSRKTDDLWPVF